MTNRACRVHFMHGFLGLARDWQQTIQFLKAPNNVELQCHDLSAMVPKKTESQPFQHWARSFIDQLSDDEDHILVGYSLGGRLALSALQELSIDTCRAAVIISSHPGGLSAVEREERQKWTEEWQQRWLKEPWQDVLEAWQSQAIFHHDQQRPVRRAADYSRSLLATMLDRWSLYRQPDYRELATTSSVPIHYIYGEKDSKYKKIAEEWSGVYSYPVPGGHSPLFTCPKHLASVLSDIIARSVSEG